MGDWPQFFHAHNRPATGTVHPNVLSRLSPSKAETTCCNCNATKGYGPGRVNTRAWAALQQVACRDPGAVRRPHRTTVAGRRSVDAARATGAHIQLSEPCARATPRGLRTRPGRTRTKPSPGNDRNGSIGAAVSCHVALARCALCAYAAAFPC
jgi:hypothetical protein